MMRRRWRRLPGRRPSPACSAAAGSGRGGAPALPGSPGSDGVPLGGDASASFADTLVPHDGKNVGVAKPVGVTGLTLSGADAGNYTLTGTSGPTSADITHATL